MAAGVPCPPFTIAGKQHGSEDERDLFPAALDVMRDASPDAIMFENVRGLALSTFRQYRESLFERLDDMGYCVCPPRVLNAADFGVPQLRPRFILVAFKDTEAAGRFRWPEAIPQRVTVGEALGRMMGSRGWPGASGWAAKANAIAPTLVGGSKKHGGPDVGPTRAREEWGRLGVDGLGIADAAPGPEFPVDGLPRLTVEMAAVIQGFPAGGWRFAGRKTAAYRQVGNALPPPVAAAVGKAILVALEGVRPDKSQPRLIREVATVA